MMMVYVRWYEQWTISALPVGDASIKVLRALQTVNSSVWIVPGTVDADA